MGPREVYKNTRGRGEAVDQSLVGDDVGPPLILSDSG